MVEFRPYRLLIGIAIGGAALTMASAVDAGFTRDFPSWARSAWALTLMAGIFAAVTLVANALGVLTAQRLGIEPSGKPSQPGRTLRVWHFVTIYGGSLVIVASLALALENIFGISSEAGLLSGCGTMFLVAASGRPWWLYATIRRLGWFAAITSDKWMKTTLAVLGIVLLLVSANVL